MSIFASQTQSDPIPLPFDPPHTVTVRKLTARELEAAAASNRRQFASDNPRLWPSLLRHALEHGAADPDVRMALTDPLLGYDRFALIRSGLVAWSYPQSVKPVVAKAADANTEAVEASDAIEDLDDEAVDFIATAILRLTKPALFAVTEADAETAQKNG